MATFEKRGDGVRARVRRGGQQHSATFDTQEEAERWAAQIEAKMKGGRHLEQLAAEQITLGDALQKYQEKILPRKKSGDNEKYRVARWRRHPLAVRPLASLRGKDFADYRDERAAENASPSTIRLELALVSNLYTVCAKEWGMESLPNPISAMKLPRAARGRERRLRDGEEAALMKAALDVHPLAPAILTVALDTAMRRGEMAAATWEETSLVHKTSRIIDPKNGETRTAPLSSRVIKALKPLEKKKGRVFQVATIIEIPDDATPAERKRLRIADNQRNAEAISRMFTEICRRAGITDLRLHDLRHEATSRLVETGRFTLIEVAMITGHKDLHMLRRYTHLSARQLADKMG